MSVISTAYSSLSDLNLWIKVQLGEELVMSDVPMLIEPRMSYIINSWSSLLPTIKKNGNDYSDINRLSRELDEFNDLIGVLITGTTPIPSASELIAQYYTVFDVMSVDDIPQTRSESDLINKEKTRVSAFTKKDFITLRNNMVSGRDFIADRIGGSDQDYNRVYDRSSVPTLLNKLPKYIDLMMQFQNGINSCTFVISNSRDMFGSTSSLDPFAFARANANNPEIDIRTYKSGRLTRLNYGESLQVLARRTMGDPERWLEIAIANGLKTPYIDEVGIKIPLIANANKNTINISGTYIDGTPNLDRISIGQIVILSSSTENIPDQRTVVSFRQIPVSGEILIELDGADDLDKYKKQENAIVRVFKKNTINSNFYILIPSTEELPPETDNETPWFLRSKKKDEVAAGVDLLIDENGDLVFGADQDLALSYGASNALQALSILMSTERGALNRHPTYGISVAVGNKNNNISQLKQALVDDISRQVLSDGRYDRLDYLDVQYLDGASGFQVRLGVVLTGGGTSVIPISFNVSA